MGHGENKEIAPEFLHVIENRNRPYDAYDYGLTSTYRGRDWETFELSISEFVNMNEQKQLPTVSIWCFQVTNIVEENHRANGYHTTRFMAEIEDKMTGCW